MKTEIEIDGEVYVKKSEVQSLASSEDKPIVMIRTFSAGVHYGVLEKKESTLAGLEVTLSNAKRVWSWSGAASLSQLAVDGTSNPSGCKIPCAVPSIQLIAIEIIAMTGKAFLSLNNVDVWKK